MKGSTVALFCCLDDFAQLFHHWQQHHLIPSDRQRRSAGKLSLGEMLSIMGRCSIPQRLQALPGVVTGNRANRHWGWGIGCLHGGIGEGGHGLVSVVGRADQSVRLALNSTARGRSTASVQSLMQVSVHRISITISINSESLNLAPYFSIRSEQAFSLIKLLSRSSFAKVGIALI